MKKITIMAGRFLLSGQVNVGYVGMIGEEYDVGVPAFNKPANTTTWRVYAYFDSSQDRLIGLRGTDSNPMYAWTNTTFYQNALGGDTEHNALLDPYIPGAH